MRSSYLQNNYGQLIESLARVYQPKKIIEIGLLDGLSFRHLIAGAPEAEIIGYDIFDEFVGKHPRREQLEAEFGTTRIKYGDFYKLHEDLQDASVDMLHVDVANSGAVLDFVLDHYLAKLSPNGICLFEGGSEERDAVEWMAKYGKKAIKPCLEKAEESNLIRFWTFGPFPSLTIIQKV